MNHQNDGCKKCTKCRKSYSSDNFIGKNNRETKVCLRCRDLRNAKHHKEKEIEDISQFSPDRRDISLLETVNRDKLNYILTHHEDFQLGKSWVNGKLVDSQAQLTLLAGYHNDLNHKGEVCIKYKQKGYSFGRYYGNRNLQLQNISRAIRHTISNDKMIDVDIKNAHPVLLSWYCKTHSIPCEGLNYYIDNRDDCLKTLLEMKGLTKDQAKQDILAITNGRDKYEGQVEGYPEWYLNYYFNMKDIIEAVQTTEPHYKTAAEKSKKANGKEGYNIGGTTVNYLMTDLENRCLMCMYDVALENKVKVGSLVYDGMMLYKDSLPSDVEGLFRKMEDRVRNVLEGCNITIIQKAMDEGFDIDNEVRDYKVKSVNHLIKMDPDIQIMFDKYETDYINKIDIDESVKYVQDLEWEPNRQVLCINSAMGTGKTTSICRWIKENDPKRVIVLSPRISYAKSICHEYNTKIGGKQPFRCYKDMKLDHIATYNRIVISMESLHKLNFDYIKANPFDLIVVDECQANLSAHTSRETNGMNFNNNSDIFYAMLRYSPKVLFCDAFINAKTLEFLTNMQLSTTLLNYTTPMKAREALIVEGNDYDTLLPYILKDLSEGKRLYVCMSSANRALEWASIIEKELPDKRIKAYTRGEGKTIVDVKKEWSELDIVITTTTITVGINFDVPHFHKCYMSFSVKSNNCVVDLFQCHYRARHLIDNEVIIHIVDIDSPSNVPYNEKEITRDLNWFERHQKILFEHFQDAPLHLKKLLCYNQLEKNISVAKLTNMVYAFLYECNYSVTTESAPCKESDDNERKEDKPESLPNFHEIELLNAIQYVELNHARGMGSPLEDNQKNQLKKYEFVKFFSCGMGQDWVDNSFDNDFWKIFNNYREVKLNNIKAEKKIRRKIETTTTLFIKDYDRNSYGVMSSKLNTRVVLMTNILSILGLECSQQTGIEISKDRIDLCIQNIRDHETEIRNVFGLKDRRKSKEELTDRSCISLLNSVFKDFGYTQIKQKKSLITAEGGKRKKNPDASYIVTDFESRLKSQKLQSGLGMKIFNSVIVDRVTKPRLLPVGYGDLEPSGSLECVEPPTPELSPDIDSAPIEENMIRIDTEDLVDWLRDRQKTECDISRELAIRSLIFLFSEKGKRTLCWNQARSIFWCPNQDKNDLMYEITAKYFDLKKNDDLLRNMNPTG